MTVRDIEESPADVLVRIYRMTKDVIRTLENGPSVRSASAGLKLHSASLEKTTKKILDLPHGDMLLSVLEDESAFYESLLHLPGLTSKSELEKVQMQVVVAAFNSSTT